MLSVNGCSELETEELTGGIQVFKPFDSTISTALRGK